MDQNGTEFLLTAFGVAAAMCLVFIAFGSFVLTYFVGLKLPPKRRAFWTVGPVYLATVIFGISGGPVGWGLIWPFAAIPGGLIAYWFWHNDFSKAWYEDVDDLPDGVNLIDDDWKNGLLKLAAVVVAAIFAAAIRSSLRN